VHELGIATSILETVRTELEKHAGARPARVGVRIGEIAAVNPEALRFAFEALTRETDLDIEICPLRFRCKACQGAFEVQDFAPACPQCGAEQTECVGGDELEIAYLEVEDEPRSARTQSAE
jgi:hydrogenase nickel incorporation protein HypA/HybF